MQLALLAYVLIASPVSSQQKAEGDPPRQSLASKPTSVSPKVPLVLPALLSLSREITKLRNSVDYVGQVRLRSTEVPDGMRPRLRHVTHLGDGWFAGPRDPGLKPGMTSVLRLGSRLYRVRYAGVDRRFAGYYRLRDREHIKALPEPRFAFRKDREKLGDLVLVVEGSSARLRLLSTWRMAMPPVASPQSLLGSPKGKEKEWSKSGRLAGWRSLEFFKLSEGGVAESALVLALDGSLVGIVSSPALDKGEKRAATGDLQIVVDGRLLLRIAMDFESSLRKLPAPDPGLGVLLVSPSIEQQKIDDTGFTVQQLIVGGPSERAGVRAGDLWMAIDGKALESYAQIREILKTLKPGKKLEIRFRRGKDQSATLWILPD